MQGLVSTRREEDTYFAYAILILPLHADTGIEELGQVQICVRALRP
jgi:hypothetical protein